MDSLQHAAASAEFDYLLKHHCDQARIEVGPVHANSSVTVTLVTDRPLAVSVRQEFENLFYLKHTGPIKFTYHVENAGNKWPEDRHCDD